MEKGRREGEGHQPKPGPVQSTRSSPARSLAPRRLFLFHCPSQQKFLLLLRLTPSLFFLFIPFTLSLDYFSPPYCFDGDHLGPRKEEQESICSLSISFSLCFLRWEHKKKTCPPFSLDGPLRPSLFSISLLFSSSPFSLTLLWDRVLLPCPAFFYPAFLPVAVPCAAR